MPIGQAPREDELALIESLARRQGNLEDQNIAYKRDMDQLGGTAGSKGTLDEFYMDDFMPKNNKKFEVIPPNKDAQAITSKYGNFDFPAIPEHEGVQGAALAQRPSYRPPSGVNKFLNQADPMRTTTSVASVNSVNLERINQRNADRLAKLENHDFNDDSAMMTMTSLKTRPQQSNNQLSMQNQSVSQDQPIPFGLNKSITMHQEQQHQRGQDEKPPSGSAAEGQQHATELEQLDDMLADILRDK